MRCLVERPGGPGDQVPLGSLSFILQIKAFFILLGCSRFNVDASSREPFLILFPS